MALPHTSAYFSGQTRPFAEHDINLKKKLDPAVLRILAGLVASPASFFWFYFSAPTSANSEALGAPTWVLWEPVDMKLIMTVAWIPEPTSVPRTLSKWDYWASP